MEAADAATAAVALAAALPPCHLLPERWRWCNTNVFAAAASAATNTSARKLQNLNQEQVKLCTLSKLDRPARLGAETGKLVYSSHWGSLY